MSEPMRIAVRAHTEPEMWVPKRPGSLWSPPEVEYVLVVDTETRTDAALGLLMAVYAVTKIDWSGAAPITTCLEEGLFRPVELAKESADEEQMLLDYVRTHAPRVDPAALLPDALDPARPDLRLLSRGAFVRDLLLPSCQTQAPVVAYNWGFDFSRIAERSSAARGKFYGGFRFVLLSVPTKTGGRAARVWARTKRLAPKRHLLELGAMTARRDEMVAKFARPLDLHTLVFALTGRSHRLDSAAAAFELPLRKLPKPVLGRISPQLIDYCRRDVELTVALYVAALTEFRRHPIGLDPSYALSPATIAAAYADRMGLQRPLRRLA